MAEKISYAILGRGRWAARMHAILASEGRRTHAIGETRAPESQSRESKALGAGESETSETSQAYATRPHESKAVESYALRPRASEAPESNTVRQRESETGEAYQARLSAGLRQTGAQIAWLCVPPGPHIFSMARAALEAGLHVVIEKPWLGSRDESASLIAFAQERRLRIGIHYEYCLLDAVANWRRDLRDGANFRFGGRFHTGRANHLNLPALENLGSHLLAIRAYAVPKASIAEIDCAYERSNERRVWLENAGEHRRSIDFLENREPIIQRFVKLFESALNGSDFPFDLHFAQRVADDVNALKNLRTL
ncbi:MAG TPA: Gfo/Idh/MocA family oxidoreductase [Candidatus Acidoferrum sp.]|jgi:hypothetical protein